VPVQFTTHIIQIAEDGGYQKAVIHSMAILDSAGTKLADVDIGHLGETFVNPFLTYR
jgi:hypothetical protein